jgi:hypothetical protein
VIEELTLSEVLDFVGSAAQGDILYRDAATWARLGAGTSGHFLQTQGAGANPQWAEASGGSGDVIQSRVVLTDTQIQSLNTTPVEVIAAPGASKYIRVLGCFAVKNTSAGTYAATANLRIRYAGIATDLVTASGLLLNSLDKRWKYFNVVDVTTSTTDSANTAVQVSSSADVTGGNAANYIVVEVLYSVVDDGP